MAGVQVCLYNGTDFKKKANSTKQPTIPPITDLSAGTVASDVSLYVKGIIIEPFSLTGGNIKFKFKAVPWVSPNYTYAWIEQFHRFYWITGWEYVNGFWVGSFGSDPLGTARDSIGVSSQFIMRCSNPRRINEEYIDSVYTAKINKHITQTYMYDTYDTEYTFGNYQGNHYVPNTIRSPYYTMDPICDHPRPIVLIINLGKADNLNNRVTFFNETTGSTVHGIQIFRTSLECFNEEILPSFASEGLDKLNRWLLGAYFCPFSSKESATSVKNRNHLVKTIYPEGGAQTHFTDASENPKYYVEWVEDKHFEASIFCKLPKRSSTIGDKKWMYTSNGRSISLVGRPFGKVPVDADVLSDTSREYMRLTFDIDTYSGSSYVFAEYCNSNGTAFAENVRKRTFIATVNTYATVPYVASGVENKLAATLGAVSGVVSIVGGLVSGAMPLIANGGAAIGAMREASQTKKVAERWKGADAGMNGGGGGYMSPAGQKVSELSKAAQASAQFADEEASSAVSGAIQASTLPLMYGLSSIVNGIAGIASAKRESTVSQIGQVDLYTGFVPIELYVEDSIYNDIPIDRVGGLYVQESLIRAACLDENGNIRESTYIQCDAPTFESNSLMPSEVLTIRNVMAQGFYYE